MSDEHALYKALRDKGLSLKAASVVLGHGLEESGNECDRVQGDFAGDRAFSKTYTKEVNENVIKRDDFVFHGPNGGGYGWLQWTFWARKAGLWNTAKEHGWSIGSVDAAVDWFWEELHQDEYRPVLAALTGDGTIREMSDVFMKRFERPADQSENACIRRAALCQQMYDKYKDEPADESGPETFWPPRVICFGMKGPDVSLLQSLLLCHGYNCGGITSIFDNRTKNMVLAFQAENNLAIDGIAGPKTFRALGVTV